MNKREQFVLENVIYIGRGGGGKSWHLFKSKRHEHYWRYAISAHGDDETLSLRKNRPPTEVLSKRFIALLKMTAFPEVI